MRKYVYALVAVIVLVGVASAVLRPRVAAQISLDESRHNAIVEAIERVAPAVVSVNVVQMQAERVSDPFSRDFWSFFYAPAPRYRLREKQLNSIGSGFIIDNQGHIVTNYHVVEDTEKVASVTLTDGREIEVELVGGDERTDLAVLQAKGSNLPYAPLGDSSEVLIGEWAIAIGNPFGVLMKDPNPSVSVGVISANHRRISPAIAKGERLYQDMIQTDAAINPGNSGGPLVNLQGEVIGINSAGAGEAQNINFAISTGTARRVFEDLVQYGRVLRPYFGAYSVDITPDIACELCLTERIGAVLVEVDPEGPASLAGLQQNDIIVSFGGEKIEYANRLIKELWKHNIGDSIKVVFWRGETEMEATVTLGERPSQS